MSQRAKVRNHFLEGQFRNHFLRNSIPEGPPRNHFPESLFRKLSTETHGPATGMVFFDGQGTAHVTGAARNSSEFDKSELYFSDLATQACDDLGCPLTSCIAGTVDMIVRQVTCNGLRLWEWPGDNPMIPDNSTTVSHARRLHCVSSCEAKVHSKHDCRDYCISRDVHKFKSIVRSL